MCMCKRSNVWAALLLVCVAVMHGGASCRPLNSRRLAALVPSSPLILSYHNGPLLTGPRRLSVYLIWYGAFTPAQRSVITDFLSSLSPSSVSSRPPSVSSWWEPLSAYHDNLNASVPASVTLDGEITDGAYSKGKTLKRSDIEALAVAALRVKRKPGAVYLVLTAADVAVERFCMDSCGFHDHTLTGGASHKRAVVYGWVGNSATQCPGQCAWPFAVPQFGPPNPPLVPPNGDVGVDGMVIVLGTVLAGAATNPYGTGYFEGDAAVPLEAATACAGTFGRGAYPGYPGQLLVDKKSKASFNAYGVHDREFLAPYGTLAPSPAQLPKPLPPRALPPQAGAHPLRPRACCFPNPKM